MNINIDEFLDLFSLGINWGILIGFFAWLLGYSIRYIIKFFKNI